MKLTARHIAEFSTRKKQFSTHVTKLEMVRVEGELPPGVCGRMQGIALVYDEIDWYDTTFARGCLDKSISERVMTRKINVFADHIKQVRCHVGVVAGVETIGDSVSVVVDLLDTNDGRLMLEYAKACVAADVETGFSIGFIPRRGEMVKDKIGQPTGQYRFLEIEWRETSVTPIPAVPGAMVTGARNEGDGEESNIDLTTDEITAILAAVPQDRLNEVLTPLGFTRTSANAEPATQTDENKPADVTPPADSLSNEKGEERKLATMDDRIKALRQSFAITV